MMKTLIYISTILAFVSGSLALEPDFSQKPATDFPILVLIYSKGGDLRVNVANKETDLNGLIAVCRDAVSKFGSVSGVNVVFKDDLSLASCVQVKNKLADAALPSERFFICPSNLWNPRSLTPAQWREISFLGKSMKGADRAH